MNIDESLVAQLVEMGFPVEGCRKAVYNTQNQGIEPAMNWVMEHMGDPGMFLLDLSFYSFLGGWGEGGVKKWRGGRVEDGGGGSSLCGSGYQRLGGRRG